MCGRDVAALTLIKGSGSFCWGAVDVLNVKFSEMKSMQSLGDGSQTLGLIFAAVGLGCFLGPLTFNKLTPPRWANPQGNLRVTIPGFHFQFGAK